jgi:hypothetical protein
MRGLGGKTAVITGAGAGCDFFSSTAIFFAGKRHFLRPSFRLPRRSGNPYAMECKRLAQ